MQKTITHLNFAKGFRGGERQTLLLITQLANKGYKQVLITRKESELADRAKGIKNLIIKKISKPYIFSLGLVKNSDILHAHETKAAQFAFFAKLFLNVPYIITRRVDNPIKDNFLNKRLYEEADYTAVLSNAIKDETLKVSLNANIKIIPSAFSEFKIDENKAKEIQKRFEDKFLIGNIGALDNTHKGQYYLIEAAKRLEKKYSDMHFIFLGRGKDEESFKEQSKDMKNITFEGFVDNVGDYISALDLFVFPSNNEGLGSILFDVILQNVPIVASNVGGIPDIVQDNKSAILTPIRDIDAIYNAIEKLYLNNNLAKDLATNAYKNIDRFSPKVMAESYEKLYANNSL